MLGKLALRNVKRQISNYLIYFITVTLTVAMMFSLCNLIFSEQLLSYARNIEQLQDGLIGISVAASIIVSFVLGYASSFMLKLRTREFGTYLTLGMTRRNILMMFTAENTLICLAALGTGILLGLVLFQGLMGLVAQLLDIKISLAGYSLFGLLLTAGLTVAMYLLSTAASALYLRKAGIHELLHAERKVEKSVKHPVVWMTVTIASFISIIVSIWGVYCEIRKQFLSYGVSGAGGMFGYIVMLFLGVVLFHIGFSKSAVHLLLKREKLKCKGANTFILRQISGQLSANSTLCGIIAFLITGAVICTNVCFANKATSRQFLDYNFPFDIAADINAEESPYTYEEALERIEKYARIEHIIKYNIYTSGNGYLHSFTPWTGKAYEQLYDSFIRESDFNHLITELDFEPVSLDDSFIISASPSLIHSMDFTGAALSIDGTRYKLKEVKTLYPILSRGYFLTVVPDEAVSGMSIDTQMAAITLSNKSFDAQALYDELSYTIQSKSGFLLERCPYNIRAYYELEENSLTAILIVGELYMAIIFVFLAVAILTMKLLSGIANDRQRYELLNKLGASRQERSRALFRQTFSLFAIPTVLPVLLSIPAAIVCGMIMKLGGYSTLVPLTYITAAMIAVVLIAIQFIYFIATYSVQKRNVIS